MSTKKFEERITTRYKNTDESTYHQVMDLVRKEGVPKSTAQLLLVQRGLVHTDNPEPLIKEKVHIVDAPKEIVQKRTLDTPKSTQMEHLTDAPILTEKERIPVAQKDKPLSVNKDILAPRVSEYIGWSIVGIFVGLIGWAIAKAKGYI